MNRIAGLTIVLMGCVAAALAQTAEVAAPPAEPIRISDEEAVDLLQSIKGHVQGAGNRGYLRLFDRKKGEEVVLRLDRIVTDDPARVVFTAPGEVAICGECTQVELKHDGDGETVATELKDKYEVWFKVKRGNMVTSRVLDVVIKSVNGNPMYEWTQDASGVWSATLVPDPM